MKKVKFYLLGICIIAIIFLAGCDLRKDLIIHIGYQSATSQIWSALIIKNQGIFERMVQDLYPDRRVKIEWHNEVSGAVINNNMISGKYQIGFMGDMPAIINCYKSNTISDYHSKIIASDGKGRNGSNQAILIPQNSTIKSINDLAGRTVTVPVGSSSHRMLLEILNQNNLLDSVIIQHQDVTVSTTMLKTNKVDAFAIWEPYCSYLTSQGTAKVLIDGADSKSDYLTGIIVDESWGNKNNDILVAFLECLLEAHDLLRNDPSAAADIIEEESSFDSVIAEKIIRSIRWDTILYKNDRDSLVKSVDFLSENDVIDKYDISRYINYTFLQKAIKNKGMAEPDIELDEWPEKGY